MNQQVTLANWRAAPFNRWGFQHVRELIPTADIPNDPRRVRELAAEKRGIDLTLERFLAETDTDGLVIVLRGHVVAEQYANGMTPETPHILMSVSKSMMGLVFGSLGIDAERPITDFVPEVGATAYAGATVRHLLDMRAGVKFDEDYLATSGPIVEYRKSTAGTRSARARRRGICTLSIRRSPSAMARTAAASTTSRRTAISSAG